MQDETTTASCTSWMGLMVLIDQLQQPAVQQQLSTPGWANCAWSFNSSSSPSTPSLHLVIASSDEHSIAWTALAGPAGSCWCCSQGLSQELVHAITPWCAQQLRLFGVTGS